MTSYAGRLTRSALLGLLAALLTGSACMPPVAFHDGLPAWAPETRGVEWRVGYQRLSVYDADSFNFLGYQFSTPDFTVGYITPGMRVGLKRPPMVAEAGLASAITARNGGFSALVGATFGLGYTAPNLNIIFRPGVYLLDFYSDEDGTGADLGYWSQVSMLVGTGYRSPGWSLAAGGRANSFGAGPLAVAGVNLRSVEFRAECSYMFPVTDYASGRSLTVGITAAAPTKREPDLEPTYRRNGMSRTQHRWRKY